MAISEQFVLCIGEEQQNLTTGTLLFSFADPGCLSRIKNPWFDFFHPGSRIQSWQDFVTRILYLNFFPGSRGTKNLRISDPNPQGFGSGSGSAWIRINLSCWIRIRIRVQIAEPDPDPGGQKWPTKTVLRIRIRDPVPFWPLDPGSGIGFFWIPDLGSQTHIFEGLVTIFWVKASLILGKSGQIFFFSISKIK